MADEASHIGIVGTGLIGAGWVAFYAAKGFGVALYDASASARRAGYDKALAHLTFLRDQGALAPEDHDKAVAGIRVSDDLPEAVQGAQLIQESVIERYDVKKEVFRQIDQAAPPEAIIASSSSGLLISELQKEIDHPERSLIAHPFNPPHLIPLVELVPGERTGEQTLSRTKAFFEGLGKVPVVLRKEVPGHIANRLQAAVWREAVDLVLKGVASVSDVDRALAAGPGLRWALLGPNMIFHLGGGEGGIGYFVDHVGVSFRKLWEDMADWTVLPAGTKEALTEDIREGMAGKSLREMARWRDEKIIEMLKIVYGRSATFYE